MGVGRELKRTLKRTINQLTSTAAATSSYSVNISQTPSRTEWIHLTSKKHGGSKPQWQHWSKTFSDQKVKDLIAPQFHTQKLIGLTAKFYFNSSDKVASSVTSEGRQVYWYVSLCPVTKWRSWAHK